MSSKEAKPLMLPDVNLAQIPPVVRRLVNYLYLFDNAVLKTFPSPRLLHDNAFGLDDQVIRLPRKAKVTDFIACVIGERRSYHKPEPDADEH